jgi:hypothetical protein
MQSQDAFDRQGFLPDLPTIMSLGRDMHKNYAVIALFFLTLPSDRCAMQALNFHGLTMILFITHAQQSGGR